ncbi:MAG: AAA family ATPase [candidate division WOR-3 bacterium]|nr:AAA family ATPase [candidate division WOR-3 bacterium]
MGKSISIVNQKGGVGKTTTAINLAVALDFYQQHCLIVDMDPQANATSGIGFTNVYPTIYDVLVKGTEPKDVIRKTNVDKLDILPSDISLVGAEVELVGMRGREMQLKRKIMSLKREYDFILIDAPPSLGLLTLNALVASDSVLIPIQVEFYAMEGLSKLLNTIRSVQRDLNSRLTIEGVLLTLFDTRLNLSHEVTQEVKRYFGDKVFEVIISRNVKLAEAPSYGKDIFAYDSESRGALDYKKLAEEVMRKNGKTGSWQGI